jgi:hypothetical protein
MNGEMNIADMKKSFFARHKRAIIIAFISLVLAICIIFLTVAYIIPAVKYNGALEDIENGNYKDAYITLKTLGNYKDCKKILKGFKLVYLHKEDAYYDEYEDLISTEIYDYNENGEECFSVKYDEEGTVITKHEKNENGDVTFNFVNYEDEKYKYVYEYTESGKLSYMEKYAKRRNRETVEKHYYEYSDGRLSSLITVDGEGFGTKEVYIYNDKGLLILSVLYNIDISVSDTDMYEAGKTEYFYDENGEKTTEVHYGYDGEITEKYGWTNGNQTLEEKYESGELTEQNKWEYNGNGKKILEKTFKITFKGEEASNRQFDENGKEILYEEYENGELVKKETHRYNEKGDMVLLERYRLTDGALELAYKQENTYKYDENGYMIFRAISDINGKITKKTEWKYSADGKMIFHAISDINGKITEKTEWKYSADGKMINKISHDENGDISEKKDYTFDSDGNIIAYTGYFGGEAPYTERNVFEFDDEGRNTLFEAYERHGDGEEILTEKEVKEYDKYGNVIYTSIYKNQYGEITKEYEYVLEYDEDGIVIKKTTYINGVMRYETTYKDPIVLYEPRERE